MSRRLRRRSRLNKAELTLTPMIDTALTLLIIFMITAPMMRNAIKVTLPDGKAQEAGETKQDLIVYIDAHSQIFFADKKLSLDRLIPTIKEKVGNNKQQTIFVRADKNVQYGEVIKVVDQIKVVGGVDYVALATQSPAQV
jgi:biopolymer transport protein ExbD